MKWLNRIQNSIPKKKLQWFLLLGCLGVAVMVFSSFLHAEEEDSPPDENIPAKTEEKQSYGIVNDEKKYEQELATVLSKIVGVDDVSVVVNLNSTGEKVVHYDVHESTQSTNEKAQKGGNRTITQKQSEKKATLYRDDKGERPLIVKQLKPEVRGVLIVARGVENLKVKALIVEAVQRVLDVPAHRVSVLPKG